ncbi:hypothetical protein SHELI_v1c06940 [Spiroplasma helicoides]|uniref:Phosphonate transport system substrate-binding protein n=1 Tax=Spiroplasma helicoides TaxID=216938 RepID=A0A1B3SL42_9MOLU|nr:PhnD/SsuA/transferrin family substrate-binding protein [Spiroplasma helicoides]AOG60643.1 hypothetical protein SHELI_v1c06940 [Spiroplasma helicoides]
MKKVLSLLASISVISTSAINAIACSQGQDDFEILFVPSVNSSEILNTVKPLEQKLKEKLKTKAEKDGRTFNKNVVINTSTSYEIAAQALKTGKADLAFLPVNTYYSYRGEQDSKTGLYSDEGILLSSSRNGATPDTTLEEFMGSDKKFDTNKAQDLMDGSISLALSKNYNKLTKSISSKKDADSKLQDSNNPATYYRTYIIANSAKLQNLNFDLESLTSDNYVKTLKDLFINNSFKFTFGKSTTSSGSVLYPIMWLSKVVGLTNEEIHNMWISSNKQENYQDGASKVSTGSYDASVNYSDARSQLGTEEAVVDAYKNTQIIGTSSAILNDGIMYSKKRLNDEKQLNDLRESFKELVVSEKEIFSVYEHTGYVGPDSIDNSDAWEKAQDETITKSNVEAQKVREMIENW